MNVEFSEYQDSCGRWHVGFFKSYKAGVNNFLLPAKILGMRLDEYYQWLIDNFEPNMPTVYKPESGFILFTWDNYKKAHDLVLFLNKAARKNPISI